MKKWKYLILFSVVLYSRVAFGATGDTVWLYGGSNQQPLYSTVQISDTSNINPPFTNDSGESGYSFDTTLMNYFAWGYTLSSTKPQWAGFKMTWEHRDLSWDARPYVAMIVKYKSTSARHKTDISLGIALGTLDSAIIDYSGSIPYASDWTTTCFKIPAASSPDLRQYVREVRFIMHKASVTDTALDVSGNTFYLDGVGLTKIAPPNGIVLKNSIQSLAGNRYSFTPKVNGSVTLCMYAVNGKLISRTMVNVVSGKQYSIRQLAGEQKVSSATQVRLIQIDGAGIAIRQKVM